MIERNKGIPEDRQIHYRIGINVGDVVAQDDDLLGDGVNVAARLEALANPGGIILSRPVRDQVRDRMQVDLADLGEVEVKNITRHVRAFQVLREGEKPIAVPRRRGARGWLLAVGVIAAALAAGAGWYLTRPDFTPVDPASMALALPAKPSIAVLPFETRGDEDGRAWIADGVTESIISKLSLAPDLIVIARSTMFSYKNRAASAADAARELGVRYVLSGSVQNAGPTIRVTAELADAVAGRQIWSLQEDSALDDFLALQDAISRRVFEELSVSLTVGESARTWIELSGGFDNYVEAIKGRAEFQKFSPEGHTNAERIWRELLRREPDQAFPYYLMGFIH